MTDRINPVRRFTLRFAWYDLWVGAYVDHKSGALYVCPLPTVLLTFRWCTHNICEWPSLNSGLPGRCLRCDKVLRRPAQSGASGLENGGSNVK